MEKTIVESVLEQMRASRKGHGKPAGSDEASALRTLASDLVRDLPQHMGPRLEAEISRHLKDALFEVQETIYRAIVGNESGAGGESRSSGEARGGAGAGRHASGGDGGGVPEAGGGTGGASADAREEAYAIEADAPAFPAFPEDDLSSGDPWAHGETGGAPTAAQGLGPSAEPTEGIEDDPAFDGDICSIDEVSLAQEPELFGGAVEDTVEAPLTPEESAEIDRALALALDGEGEGDVDAPIGGEVDAEGDDAIVLEGEGEVGAAIGGEGECEIV
ncbi:MAG: hypothetical protein JXP34_11015, partial [Planctomycetes bacterium]|nr:hypothetical protein [Planctomycetota bacterium]